MLEQDLARLPRARILRIDYEEFCRHPREQLARFARFSAAHGLEFRDKAPVPAAFRNRMRGETKGSVRELKDLVNALYANWEFAELG
jgi:hypothetical protein